MITSIVIDDDPDTVAVFCDYLEMNQIMVIGKGFNGKDAVELYQKLKPDIVFADVMMPEYDGFYALEKIRQIDPDTKIIMVTADLRAETEHRLKALKATGIVFKPFDIRKIMEIIYTIAPMEIQTSSRKQSEAYLNERWFTITNSFWFRS